MFSLKSPQALKELSILGAGSWGTALAIVLGPRFDRVRLWSHDTGLADEVGCSRENVTYLPGFRLPDNVELTDDLERAVSESGHRPARRSLAAPTEVFQGMCSVPGPEMLFVSATKGIETGSLARMSESCERNVRSLPESLLSRVRPSRVRSQRATQQPW